MLTKKVPLLQELPEVLEIPKVPKETIEELAKRIKPLFGFDVNVEGSSVPLKDISFYIEEVKLFTQSFIWDPKPKEIALGLKPIGDIKTLHTYGYGGFFKPTIAEVLAQIPKECLDKVVAFEIVWSPDTTMDFKKFQKAYDAGYHMAVTRLYVKK